MTFEPEPVYDPVAISSEIAVEYAKYSDFMTFSDVALQTDLGPVVQALAKQMAENMVYELNQYLGVFKDVTEDLVASANQTIAPPFLYKPYPLYPP